MSRPHDLTPNYLGGQPRFGDLKLQLDSHKHPEFKLSHSNVLIKFKTGIPLKVTTRLTQCATGKDLPDYVFVQRKKTEDLRLHVNFPECGWYKLMVFALEESDPAESLPNVFNYLINVEKTHKTAYPNVKGFTKFYTDSCFLDDPLELNPGTSNLSHVKFNMIVPGAKKVAVHAAQEWHQLADKGKDKWEGKVDLTRARGGKVTVNANYGASDTYSTLLEYNV